MAATTDHDLLEIWVFSSSSLLEFVVVVTSKKQPHPAVSTATTDENRRQVEVLKSSDVFVCWDWKMNGFSVVVVIPTTTRQPWLWRIGDICWNKHNLSNTTRFHLCCHQRCEFCRPLLREDISFHGKSDEWQAFKITKRQSVLYTYTTKYLTATSPPVCF